IWSSTRGSISGGVSHLFQSASGPVGLSLPQLRRAKSASSKSHARLLQPQGAAVLAGALPMIRHFAAVLAATILLAGPAAAQQSPPPPIPLYPGAAPRSIEPEPLPPLPPARSEPPAAMPLPPPVGTALPPPPSTSPLLAAPPVVAGPATEGVFCDQPVMVRLPDRGVVPERYRPFVGIWSDA